MWTPQHSAIPCGLYNICIDWSLVRNHFLLAPCFYGKWHISCSLKVSLNKLDAPRWYLCLLGQQISANVIHSILLASHGCILNPLDIVHFEPYLTYLLLCIDITHIGQLLQVSSRCSVCILASCDFDSVDTGSACHHFTVSMLTDLFADWAPCISSNAYCSSSTTSNGACCSAITTEVSVMELEVKRSSAWAFSSPLTIPGSAHPSACLPAFSLKPYDKCSSALTFGISCTAPESVCCSACTPAASLEP